MHPGSKPTDVALLQSRSYKGASTEKLIQIGSYRGAFTKRLLQRAAFREPTEKLLHRGAEIEAPAWLLHLVHVGSYMEASTCLMPT